MASHPIYQLYVELNNFRPKIWRRFQLMNNVSMAKLAYMLMSIYEMEGRHHFNFEVPVLDNFKVLVGDYINSPENAEAVKMLQQSGGIINIELMYSDMEQNDGRPTLNALDLALGKVLNGPNERLTFNYDYGDGWSFTIVLEEVILDKDIPGKSLPLLIDGSGYGIIEDCGGVDGLADIVRAFKDKGDGYEEYSDWLGVNEFDIENLDLDDLTTKLKKYPKLFKDAYESEDEIYYEDEDEEDLSDISAEQLWSRFSPDVQRMILNSSYCPNCSITSIIDFTTKLDEYDLVLTGKCSKCGISIERVVEY